MDKVDRSEITPEALYLSRRAFMRRFGVAMAGLTVGSTVFAACARPEDQEPAMGGALSATRTPEETNAPATTPEPTPPVAWPPLRAGTDELGDPLTEDQLIQSYNNYYEFSFGKSDVAERARDLVTYPWTVQVGGLVDHPKTYDLQELLAFPQEERIYRMRCVEGWSMVIPWIGFPLSRLLEAVSPKPEAQYVRFVTLYDPQQMPNQGWGTFPFPYVEGLRLDEAMHDLTILATGLYGKALTPQTGAPIRLVVPWKYGFKSIKSVVQIDLVDEMPTTTWMGIAPHEYGFYANVNPEVPHPRWSQATERRIGESGRRRTLLYNGYEDEVAHLYAGMDLTQWY